MYPNTTKTPQAITAADRAAFDNAMGAIRAEHAVMRDLATFASQRPAFWADYTMSLADTMLAHESAEARLFDLPFVSRPPDSIASTAERARQRCIEYTSGSFHVPDAHAAAALFIDALLTHLAVEDAWLNKEDEHQKDRLRTIA
jgi:hypothetical protein